MQVGLLHVPSAACKRSNMPTPFNPPDSDSRNHYQEHTNGSYAEMNSQQAFDLHGHAMSSADACITSLSHALLPFHMPYFPFTCNRRLHGLTMRQVLSACEVTVDLAGDISHLEIMAGA